MSIRPNCAITSTSRWFSLFPGKFNNTSYIRTTQGLISQSKLRIEELMKQSGTSDRLGLRVSLRKTADAAVSHVESWREAGMPLHPKAVLPALLVRVERK